MLEQLTKSNARIKYNLFLHQTARQGETDSLVEKYGDFAHHILVGGLLLHRARRPAHMHQDDPGPHTDDDLGHRRIASQSRDIVYQHRSRVKSRLRDRGFRGIDGNRNPDGLGHCSHDGNRATTLFQLIDRVDVQPADLKVRKTRFSAFIRGASDLEGRLRERAVETVIVTGTGTGTCCESTARDAMMLNFATIMVSDGNACSTDAEHNASLTAFLRNFGDVMTTDELVGFIERNGKAADAA